MSENRIETFVTTEYLAKNLENREYKVVDLREYEKYEKGHIIGSVHINNSIFAQQNEDGLNILPKEEILLVNLREKGINSNDKLILVDDVFNLNCSLAAWTLHYFGFFNVNLLDGALAKWEEENLPLTTEIPEFPKGDISFKVENPNILITKDEILININSNDITYVDNRSEYALVLDQQGGNIPGAIHHWYLDLFEEFPNYFILKEKEIISKELLAKGIKKNKTIAVYCESAPQSALVYLVLKELAYPDVRLYLAGYDEWRIICSFM
ncbi:MAG: sulfurtransferase [Candidatus Heimdallarchaeaceae archaeon]|jgi:thiosulfate/3-mercaptopyruvate sulfurtransferase